MRLTCHQIVLQNEFFDDVIGDQLSAVHNGIAGNVGHTSYFCFFFNGADAF